MDFGLIRRLQNRTDNKGNRMNIQQIGKGLSRVRVRSKRKRERLMRQIPEAMIVDGDRVIVPTGRGAEARRILK